MHSFGRVAFEIRRFESKDVLRVLSSSDSFIGDGAIIEIVHRALELLQTEVKTRTSRQQLMLHVFDIVLPSPGATFLSRVRSQVCSLGEQHQPHGVLRAI